MANRRFFMAINKFHLLPIIEKCSLNHDFRLYRSLQNDWHIVKAMETPGSYFQLYQKYSYPLFYIVNDIRNTVHVKNYDLTERFVFFICHFWI